MTSYPLAEELPALIDTSTWSWQPFVSPRGEGEGFFVGTDADGNAWLTKMRGSFRGYRELVFERLVQRAGWLCQSSTFTILDSSCLPMKKASGLEQVQLVTRLLEEHAPQVCGPDCPLELLSGDLSKIDGDALEALSASPLGDALNIARQDILAYLLGGFEPADCLTTVDHKVFLIDGELMFDSGPHDVRANYWWRYPDGSPWPLGQQLTCEITASIAAFQDSDLEEILRLPKGLTIDRSRSIRVNSHPTATPFSRPMLTPLAHGIWAYPCSA